jgi:hypothetical protein
MAGRRGRACRMRREENRLTQGLSIPFLEFCNTLMSSPTEG